MSLSPQAALVFRGGPREGDTISLSEAVTTLGRSSENSVVVDEEGVSRQHAEIRRDGGGYSVVDLDSLNGTYVNDVRIGEGPHRLRNWDRVDLGGMGDSFWVFRDSQATVAIPRPRRYTT